jgi:hypothetical protein
LKLTKNTLKQLIKEELEEALSSESQDPLVKVLELLEEVLSEVELDAGAYDHPRTASERDRIRAQTAINYIPELKQAIQLLEDTIGKPAVSGVEGEDRWAALERGVAPE